MTNTEKSRTKLVLPALIALGCTWLSWLAQGWWEGQKLHERVEIHLQAEMHEGVRDLEDIVRATALNLEHLTVEVDRNRENIQDVTTSSHE